MILIFLFVFFGNSSFSQMSNAVHYANIITAENLKQHIEILASDSLEGRASGEIGQKKAAKYIRNFYLKSSIKPYLKGGTEYFQSFNINVRKYGWKEIAVNNSYSNWQHLFIAGNDSAYSDSVAPYYAGFASSVDKININGKQASVLFQSTNLKNAIKIVDKLRQENQAKTFFINFPQHRKYYKKLWSEYQAIHGTFFEKRELNENEGIIPYTKQYSENTELEDVLLRYTIQHSDIRVIIIDNKLFENMTGTKAKSDRKRDDIDCFETQIFFKHNDHLKTLATENILACVEGKKYPDEYIVIMAHYDHLGRTNKRIYNGADDNASGTAALIEIARAFSQAQSEGVGPERSVLFVATTGEELGLLGSKYFILSEDIQISSLKAGINMDMIGRCDKDHNVSENYVYTFPKKRIKKEMKKILQKSSENIDNFEIDKSPGLIMKIGSKYASDQYYFVKNNIPSISFMTGLHKDYHTPNDTHEKINYTNAEKISRLVFLTAWQLAN